MITHQSCGVSKMIPQPTILNEEELRKVCYRKLNKYKYKLEDDYVIDIHLLGFNIVTDYIVLYENGILVIKKGYCWDGPSGPTIDTLTFMRGSLVHDVLYQLLRLQLLPKSYRKIADIIIRILCLQDGMNWWRAGYVYYFLRLFGWFSTKPEKINGSKIKYITLKEDSKWNLTDVFNSEEE